jgi:hypothetical protein
MSKFLQATNLTWSDSTATSVFQICPVIHCEYTFYTRMFMHDNKVMLAIEFHFDITSQQHVLYFESRTKLVLKSYDYNVLWYLFVFAKSKTPITNIQEEILGIKTLLLSHLTPKLLTTVFWIYFRCKLFSMNTAWNLYIITNNRLSLSNIQCVNSVLYKYYTLQTIFREFSTQKKREKM